MISVQIQISEPKSRGCLPKNQNILPSSSKKNRAETSHVLPRRALQLRTTGFQGQVQRDATGLVEIRDSRLDVSGLHGIYMDLCGLSWIIMDLHGLTWDYHGFTHRLKKRGHGKHEPRPCVFTLNTCILHYFTLFYPIKN